MKGLPVWGLTAAIGYWAKQRSEKFRAELQDSEKLDGLSPLQQAQVRRAVAQALEQQQRQQQHVQSEPQRANQETASVSSKSKD
jgi:gas vesicle protein